MDGGSSPENVVHRVRGVEPERVLVVEAAEMEPVLTPSRPPVQVLGWIGDIRAGFLQERTSGVKRGAGSARK